MPAEFRWTQVGMLAEEMTEVKLVGEIQLRRHVLDLEPLVGQEQPCLVEPHAVDVLVDGALA